MPVGRERRIALAEAGIVGDEAEVAAVGVHDATEQSLKAKAIRRPSGDQSGYEGVAVDVGDLAQVMAVRSNGEDLDAVVGLGLERDPAVPIGERGGRRRREREGGQDREDRDREDRSSAADMRHGVLLSLGSGCWATWAEADALAARPAATPWAMSAIAATDSAGRTPSITIAVGLAVRIDEREAHDRTEIVDDRDPGAVRRPRGIDVAVDAGQQALVGAVGVGNVEEEGLSVSGGQVGEAVAVGRPAGPDLGPSRHRSRCSGDPSTCRIQRSVALGAGSGRDDDPVPVGMPRRRVDLCEWRRVEDAPIRSVGVHHPDPVAVLTRRSTAIFVPSGEKIGDQLMVVGITNAHRRARAIGRRDEDLVDGALHVANTPAIGRQATSWQGSMSWLSRSIVMGFEPSALTTTRSPSDMFDGPFAGFGPISL